MENKLKCENCTWTGDQEECVRKFRGISGTGGVVEEYLECPICGNESLIPLDSEPAMVIPTVFQVG